jgi:hypothetical protein
MPSFLPTTKHWGKGSKQGFNWPRIDFSTMGKKCLLRKSEGRRYTFGTSAGWEQPVSQPQHKQRNKHLAAKAFFQAKKVWNNVESLYNELVELSAVFQYSEMTVVGIRLEMQSNLLSTNKHNKQTGTICRERFFD